MGLKIRKVDKRKPYFGIIFGDGGIGKTTMATHANNPAFIDLENKLESIKGAEKVEYVKEVDGKEVTSKIDTYPKLKAVMQEITKEDKIPSVDTIVIDSTTKIQEMIENYVTQVGYPDQGFKDGEKVHVSRAGWNKGVTGEYTVPEWQAFLRLVNDLQDNGYNVLLISHEQKEKISPVDDDPYYRMAVDIKPEPKKYVLRYANFAVYIHYKITVISPDKGKAKVNNDVDSKREIVTSPRAGIEAKSTENIPSIIDFGNASNCGKEFFKLLEQGE